MSEKKLWMRKEKWYLSAISVSQRGRWRGHFLRREEAIDTALDRLSDADLDEFLSQTEDE